ncbi:MAG TPA: hypothetical protein VK671_13220 [Mucilaginibacter sp.]|nr:hypothetical protein [Mucilaginibacter sp.]
MADDISKKIIIEVEAQTGKLQQNISSLNQVINELQANQQKLIASGNEGSAAFEKTATAIDKYQKQLDTANKQLKSFNSGINSSSSSLKKSQTMIEALAKANDKLSKSIAGSSAKLKELDKSTNSLASSAQSHQAKTQQSKAAIDAHSKSLSNSTKQAKQLKKGISDLNTGLKQQQSHAKQSKTAFDAHKTTMDHLKKSFDEIKGVSGIFGPSLQDAAKGFNVMKTGLDLVHGGLDGVGEAIKTDGFGFLLDIIQKIYDYFIHTSTGSKILKGAISAIGVIVNKVTSFFHSFMNGIINAFSHPIDTLKSLGRMIEQNLINRFKAFGVILDGIIHLDFKKMANGAIQAFTGVTDATDKIGTAFTTVKNGIKETVGEMVGAYEKGYDEAGKQVDAFEKKTKDSLDRQKRMQDD